MRAIDIDYFVTEWAKEHLDVDLYDLEYEYEHFFDELPIVEAEPVRHGHWVYDYFEELICEHIWHCSLCGNESFSDKHNYCSNCGAKMDEEVEKCEKENL